MPRLNLRDDQWSRIAHLPPGKPGDRGRTAVNNRRGLDLARLVSTLPRPSKSLLFHTACGQGCGSAAGMAPKTAWLPGWCYAGSIFANRT